MERRGSQTINIWLGYMKNLFQIHFKVKHGTISTEKLEFAVLCTDKSEKGENYAPQ